MYGFQNEDFLKTLNGAVAQIGEINRIADKVSDLGYKTSIWLEREAPMPSSAAGIHAKDKLRSGMVS